MPSLEDELNALLAGSANIAEGVSDAKKQAGKVRRKSKDLEATMEELATMGEAVGYTPKRALLLELTEAEATARMAADGAGAPPAQRLKSFHMHTRGMITELEQSQLLRRLDASLGADALLAAAQDALRGL